MQDKSAASYRALLRVAASFNNSFKPTPLRGAAYLGR